MRTDYLKGLNFTFIKVNFSADYSAYIKNDKSTSTEIAAADVEVTNLLHELLARQLAEFDKMEGATPSKIWEGREYPLERPLPDLADLSGLIGCCVNYFEKQLDASPDRVKYIEGCVNYLVDELLCEDKTNNDLSLQYMRRGYIDSQHTPKAQSNRSRGHSLYQMHRNSLNRDFVNYEEGYFGMVGSYLVGIAISYSIHRLLHHYELAEENGKQKDKDFVKKYLLVQNPTGKYYSEDESAAMFNNDIPNKVYNEQFNKALAAQVAIWSKKWADPGAPPTFTMETPLLTLLKYSRALTDFEYSIQEELKQLQPAKFLKKFILQMDQYVRHSYTHEFNSAGELTIAQVGYRHTFYTKHSFMDMGGKGGEFLRPSLHGNEYIGQFDDFFTGIAYAYMRPQLDKMQKSAEAGETVTYVPIFGEAKAKEAPAPPAPPAPAVDINTSKNGNGKPLPKLTFHGETGDLVNLLHKLQDAGWITIPAKDATSIAKYMLRVFEIEGSPSASADYIRQVWTGKEAVKNAEKFEKIPINKAKL